jgi:hypothetical protein
LASICVSFYVIESAGVKSLDPNLVTSRIDFERCLKVAAKYVFIVIEKAQIASVIQHCSAKVESVLQHRKAVRVDFVLEGRF